MKKVVFITGASSGFGNLTAKKFQKHGYQVVATMRSPEKERELNQLKNIELVKLDVTDPNNIKDAIDYTIEKYGRIDVLVNNAGYGAFGYLEEASDAEIQNQVDVNFTGVLNTSRAAIPYMRKQKSGVIINVTSLAGTIGMPFASLYNATKFAVEGLTQALQFELATFGIKVRTVAPGGFKTNFMNAVQINKGEAKPELDYYRGEMESTLNKMMSEPPKPFDFGDPQVVADLIYKCATEDTKVINYVGKDARMMSKVIRLMGKKRVFKMLGGNIMPKFKRAPQSLEGAAGSFAGTNG